MTTSTLDYNAGTGDGFGTTVANYIDTTSTEIDIGTDGTNNDRDLRTWIPFVVNLARGQQIVSATLKVIAVSNSSSTTSNIKVGCEASDNVSALSTAANLLARPFTSATITTTLVQYTAGVTYTYDVTAAVQEILNRSGWVGGNTLACMIDDQSSAPKYHRAYSADNGSNVPVLEIVINSFVPRASGLL